MALRFVCLVAVFFHVCYGAVLEKNEECLTKVSDIHAKTDLDIHKFSGAWYTHLVTDYVFTEKKWDSLTNMVYLNGEEDLTMVTSGHQDGSEDCKTVVLHLKKKDNGVYSGPFITGNTFLIEVLYTDTDYTTTAVYVCFNVKDDGSCEQHSEEMELWSRKPDDLTDDQETDLKSHIENIKCIDIHDLRKMVQGKCETASSVEDHSETHICEPPAPGHTETTVTCKCNPSDNETAVVPESRPHGDWQSIIVATHEGEEATGSSYKFTPSVESNILYVSRSHQSGETCSEGTVDKFQRLSEHHYLQMFESIPEELWIFPIKNNKLVVFTCSKRYRGSCLKGHSHVEMLGKTTDTRPVNYDALKMFSDRLDKKFCTHYTYHVDQKAGFCKPSHIQGRIVELNDQLHHSGKSSTPEATLVAKHKCKLDDIPLQDSFEISQLAGLWYEIAGPLSSAKGFESGAEYYSIEDDHTAHSSYSGAEDNRCTPAITSHIRQSTKSTKSGDLEMTFHGPHGPHGLFDWISLKMVYNDGEYALYYDCYLESPPGVCVRGKPTIIGRRPTIDEHTKHKLYDMLPSLCTSADQMVQTIHNTDCSDWAMPHTDETEPHHCHVYEIPVQHKVSMDLMLGTWYIVASKHSDTNLLEIRRDGSTFVADAYAKREGKCSKVMTEAFTQHDAEHNGDFLLSQCDVDVSPYSSLKIVYTDYHVGVFYICTEENTDGDCTSTGTRSFIMSREKTISSLQLSTLTSQLKLPCEDLSDLHPVHEHCEPSKECHVSDIHVVEHLNKQKLTGVWYDIMRSSPTIKAESGAFSISVDSHGHLHLKYSGIGSDGNCSPAKTSDMRQRHDDKVDGEMLTTPLDSHAWGFFTAKILYTDYDNALVTYVCTHIDHNDECLDKRGHIMSRKETLTEEEKTKLMHYLDMACIHSEDVTETTHEVDCTAELT